MEGVLRRDSPLGANRNSSGSVPKLRPSVPDLDFTVDGVQPLQYSLTPFLAFRLKIENSTAMPVHSIVLQCQTQIDAPRREYSDTHWTSLADLFGRPDQWPQTLRSLLWANVTTVVPAFEKSTESSICLPCTFDFTVATTKYFS